MCQIEQFSLPSMYNLKCPFASVIYSEGEGMLCFSQTAFHKFKLASR